MENKGKYFTTNGRLLMQKAKSCRRLRVPSIIAIMAASVLLFQALLLLPLRAAVDTQAPAAPAGLSVANATYTSISLCWSASKDDTAVKGYQIYRDGKKILSTSKTSYTNTDLIPGSKYAYFVRAYDATGNVSEESATLTASTISDTQNPTQPAGLSVSSRTYTQITLTWNPSRDNTSIRGYEVSCSDKNPVKTRANYYTVTRLQPGRSYTISVKAYDIAGNYSLQSNIITVATMADTTAPSVPAGLKAGETTPTEINITWLPSSDNVKLKAYEVYCNGEKVKTTSKNSFTGSKLAPGTTYTYGIRAVDATGNASPLSNSLKVTTAADNTAPSAPTALKVKSAKKSSVSLAWTASKDNVKVKGYLVYWNGIQIAETSAKSYTVKIPVSLGVDCFYVKAYDTSGNVSEKSSTAVALSFG
jgi:chitodextrinase